MTFHLLLKVRYAKKEFNTINLFCCELTHPKITFVYIFTIDQSERRTARCLDQSTNSTKTRKTKTMSDLTKSLYALKEPLKAKVNELSEKSLLYQHVSFVPKFEIVEILA